MKQMLLSADIEGIRGARLEKLRAVKSENMYVYRVDRRLRGICELSFSNDLNSYVFELIDLVDNEDYGSY